MQLLFRYFFNILQCFFLFSEGEGDFRGGQLFVQNEVQIKSYVQSYRIVAGKMPGTGGEEKCCNFYKNPVTIITWSLRISGTDDIWLIMSQCQWEGSPFPLLHDYSNILLYVVLTYPLTITCLFFISYIYIIWDPIRRDENILRFLSRWNEIIKRSRYTTIYINFYFMIFITIVKYGCINVPKNINQEVHTHFPFKRATNSDVFFLSFLLSGLF